MAMEHFDDKIVPGLVKKHQTISCTSSIPISSSVLMPSLSFPSPVVATPNSRVSKFKDELLAHKKQTLEMIVKQTQALKKGKKALNKVKFEFLKSNPL